MAGSITLADLAPEDRMALRYDHPALDDHADQMGSKYGLPPGLVRAIKNAGERSNSDQVSEANAMGVMQIIPSTQAMLGIKNPKDPLQSIEGGAKYLAQLSKQLGTSDPAVLAAAYHAGPSSAAVRGNFTKMPRTEAYVSRVNDFLSKQPAAPASNGISYDDLSTEDKLKLHSKSNPNWMDPTEGMSTTDRALAGAGKFFSDTGSGLRQIAANVVNPVSQALTGKDALAQDYEGEKERSLLDDALMSTPAGIAGYMGASASTLALPGGVAAGAGSKIAPAATWLTKNPRVLAAVGKYFPTAVAGGALGTLTPTTHEGERGENAAMSAALGPVFQKGAEGVAKVAAPVTRWIGDNINLGPLLRKSWSAEATPQQRAVVGRAMMNDVPVYPQQLENPGAPISRGRSDDQMSKLSRAFNATMGEETEDIPAAFSAARQRISDTYNALLDNKVIPLGQQSGPPPANGLPNPNGGGSSFVQRLIQIRNAHMQGHPMVDTSPQLLDSIERAISYAKNNGSLTGRQFQDLLRQYAAGANQELKGNILNGTKSNPRAAQGFSDLSDALTQEAEKVMAPHELGIFRKTNKEFRNMKTLESLAPIQIDGQADYNPTAIARKLARSDKNAFLYNKGDLTQSELAKFGATYMGMDKNSPHSLLQRGKDMIVKSAPILVGDALGAVLAGEAMGAGGGEEGDPSLAAKMLKYGALAALTHGVVTGGKNALNPRMTMNQLGQPRGALSELVRRSTFAPGAAAVLPKSEEDATTSENP